MKREPSLRIREKLGGGVVFTVVGPTLLRLLHNTYLVQHLQFLATRATVLFASHNLYVPDSR